MRVWDLKVWDLKVQKFIILAFRVWEFFIQHISVHDVILGVSWLAELKMKHEIAMANMTPEARERVVKSAEAMMADKTAKMQIALIEAQSTYEKAVATQQAAQEAFNKCDQDKKNAGKGEKRNATKAFAAAEKALKKAKGDTDKAFEKVKKLDPSAQRQHVANDPGQRTLSAFLAAGRNISS